jgi:hypothetical protein
MQQMQVHRVAINKDGTYIGIQGPHVQTWVLPQCTGVWFLVASVPVDANGQPR